MISEIDNFILTEDFNNESNLNQNIMNNPNTAMTFNELHLKINRSFLVFVKQNGCNICSQEPAVL